MGLQHQHHLGLVRNAESVPILVHWTKTCIFKKLSGDMWALSILKTYSGLTSVFSKFHLLILQSSNFFSFLTFSSFLSFYVFERTSPNHIHLVELRTSWSPWVELISVRSCLNDLNANEWETISNSWLANLVSQLWVCSLFLSFSLSHSHTHTYCQWAHESPVFRSQVELVKHYMSETLLFDRVIWEAWMSRIEMVLIKFYC